MTPSGGRQHALRRPRDKFPRIQDHGGATRQGKVAFTVDQAVTGQVHRGQTRRTCGVHRQRGTVDPQGVSDPPGRQAEAAAGKAIRPLHGMRIGGQQLVVAVRQAHEHTGQRVGHRLPGQPGMLHGLPGGFQQQPVLRVDRGGLALVDPEEIGIEAGDVIEERAPLRHRPTRHPRLGVVVLVGVPPVGRNLGDQVIAAQQRLPQPLGRVDAPGKPTSHADDSNGSDTCFIHRRSPSSHPLVP